MPQSPYYHLIQRYFPIAEWGNADCIAVHECSPSRPGYPETCIALEGLIDCGQGPVEAKSWGPFQILDACWNPDLNPNSPFSREQWAQVMDPNVNTWMASVIWSRGGWRAWTTCDRCNLCDHPGGVIPYPDGPIEGDNMAPAYPTPPSKGAPVALGLGVVGVALILALTA